MKIEEKICWGKNACVSTEESRREKEKNGKAKQDGKKERSTNKTRKDYGTDVRM